MEDKATMNVIVHKAAIQLAQGETLGMFTQALNTALKDYVSQKLNLSKNGSCWSAEVTASQVVASVYDYKEGSPSTSKYVAVGYSRDKDGNFEFTDMSEVRPVTTYAPVKSSNNSILPKVNMPYEVKTAKAAHDLSARWESLSKGFWNGVV